MVLKGQVAAPERGGPLLASYEQERRGTDERILQAIETGAHTLQASRDACIR